MTFPIRLLRERRRVRGGFTVIELLVATGITAVLAAFLIAITVQILTHWNRSRGALVSNAEAKVALDQIAADLEALVIAPQPGVWLVATVSGPQALLGGAAKFAEARYPAGACKPSGAISLDLGDRVATERPPAINDLRFGHVGAWLRFFTVEPDSNDGVQNQSAVRAVGYQICRIPPYSGAPAGEWRYYLFRSSVRAAPLPGEVTGLPRSTFTAGYNLAETARYNDPYSGADNDGVADPGSLRQPERSLIIAGNVIDFGVRIFERDASGVEVERYPVDRTLGSTQRRWAFLAETTGESAVYAFEPAPYGLSGTPVYGRPSSIEIMIRVLTEEGAELIEAIERGAVPAPSGAGAFEQFWWERALAHSRVYTRRVEIAGNSR